MYSRQGHKQAGAEAANPGETTERVDAVTLEDAAELIGESIERDGNGREVIRRDNGNGGRLELRRSHIFDERGVQIELFGPGDGQPRMSSSVFPMARFRHVMNWFLYLYRRAEVLESESSLDRLAREYNQAVVNWESNRLP